MRGVEGLRALVAPFVHGPVTQVLRCLRDAEYRRHYALQVRLAGLPRHEARTVECAGLRVEIVDAPSFLSAHRDIFVEEIYRFPCAHDAPFIVDLGANIGLATLWFKRAYPRARILALEPDPSIYACLERNVLRNGITGVELLNRAAWNADTELEFFPDGADGGRSVAGTIAAGRAALNVPAVAIDRLLSGRQVDFLKIDIEGAEDVVLAACTPILPRVGCLFVEYHAPAEGPSRLGSIVSSLEEAGFRLRVQDVGARRPPYSAGAAHGFDSQINLFARRDG